MSIIGKYEFLNEILTDDSKISISKHRSVTTAGRVDAVCQKCSKISNVDLISIIKTYGKKLKKKQGKPLYECHSCSKESELGISLKTVYDYIDIDSTILKYGGIPKNVKLGMVVVKCEDCAQTFDIKLSSLLHQARRHKQNGRSCVYKCLSCGNKREDVLKNNVESRLRQIEKGFKSGLEVAVENRLKIIGIKYQCQHQIGMYLWDFFLPEHSIVIDVNGEYWHQLPENVAKDKSKKTYASRYAPDVKQLIIEEVSILNPNNIDRLIFEAIGQSVEIDQIDFSFKDLGILHIPLNKSAMLFLDSYHYAKSGRPSKNVFGVYFNDELIGVMKFSPVTRKESAVKLGLKCTEVYELDRLCIHPNFHKKNFASWFLSRGINSFLSNKPGVKCLISFSDPTFGHTGTIYKASNWTDDGFTKSSYHYIDRSGCYINKKRVFDIASRLKMKESEYAEKHMLEKFKEKPKKRFLYYRR